MKQWLIVVLLCLPLMSQATGSNNVPLRKANVDFSDKASLQRGAKWYMNYCASCHSMQYMRYSRMAKDLKIVDRDGKILKELLKKNLIFTGANPGDSILTAIPPKQSASWFGVKPPDLSLKARVRGADWLYTYLMSFYADPERQWGSNNWLFKDVGMPNVLVLLQGQQVAKTRQYEIPIQDGTRTIEVVDHLQLLETGSMSEHEFEQVVHDIVNFMAYVAEPFKPSRLRIGFWVIGFLLVLLVLTILLKKEFWKDVH